MLKKYDLNDKITVSFDADDTAFAHRVFNTLNNLNRLEEEFTLECKTLESREVFKIASQTDAAIQPIPLKQFGRIPALAQGAVIPPNREFLAVLGDQKSGTNIETPLPTMIQAVRQALAEVGYNGQSEAYLMLDDIQLGKVIYRLNKAEGNRIGVSLV